MNVGLDTARRFAVWLAAVGLILAGNLAGQSWLEWAGVVLLAALVAVGIWQRRINLEALASLPVFSAYAAPLGLLVVGMVASTLLLEASRDFLSAVLIVVVTASSGIWIAISTRRLLRRWRERTKESSPEGDSAG